MAKKKVCVISLHHPALDSRIYYKEAITLRNAGYDVHIICRLNNKTFTEMGGKPIGCPNKNMEWNYDGFTFHGVLKRKGFFGKWLEYKETIKIGLSIKANFYHCHESNIALAAALKIKQKIGMSSKLIFDIHEFSRKGWTERVPFGFKNVYYFLFLNWEKKAINHTDYLITANSITRAYFLIDNKYKKVEILQNVPILSIFKDKKKVTKENNCIIICHEGSLSFNRGLKEMVSIVENAKYKIILKIIGNVPYKEEKWLKNKFKDNLKLLQFIQITGWLPYKDVGNVLSDCDIGLILFFPTTNNMLAGPPNKLFNYMRYGIPVVSVDLPETRAIIAKYKCGIIVKDWKISSIISAVQYLINHPNEAKAMGQRGKEAILKELNWEREGNKLLRVYAELQNREVFDKF